MVIVHPNVLWLALLVPVLGRIAWRSESERSGVPAMFRSAAILAMIAALARPFVGLPDATPRHVTVLDYGSRLPADRGDGRTAAAGDAVVAFSSRAQLASTPNAQEADLRAHVARPLWPDDTPQGGVNLAAALRLAGAAIPNGVAGRVRLVASGLSDHGDAEAEAWTLARRGVAVEVTPTELRQNVSPPLRVRGVTLPARARIGQTLACEVEIEATVRDRVRVRVSAGRNESATATVDVVPGLSRVTVPLTLTAPGLAAVRVGLTPDHAPHSDSGAAMAAVDVAPAASLLLVSDDAASDQDAALSAMLTPGFDVRTVGPTGLTPEAVAAADVIVLADVPAGRLSASAQGRLVDAVKAGAGLLVTGTTRSFGPGGYGESALAPLLPVAMPQPAQQTDPSVAVVFIIDTSGSMQGERIDLAKEIARLALSHLSPDDRAGIVEFFGGRRWAAPLQPASHAAVIARALNRLTAAGGTTLYPAVEEAAFALRNVEARSKHVLVLSDGFVEDAPFAALVRGMNEDGVTVSAVQVGRPDAGLPNMMPDLARWGGGRLYKVPDEQTLPDIRFKDPQTSPLSMRVDGPQAVQGGADALVRAVDASAWPGVDGYVRTKAKPTADVLLRTAGGDPLLARWRAGAGYVAALPTRLGSISVAGLQARPAFVRLMSGLVRQLAGDRDGALRLTTRVRPAGLEVDVSVAGTDAAIGGRPLTLVLLDEAGKTLRTVTSEPVTDGHWNLLLPGVTAGVYRVGASVDGTAATAWGGVAVPIPPSAAASAGDRALLDRIASYAPMAAEQAKQLRGAFTRYHDLRPALAVVAVTLLLTHVAVRRWPTLALNRQRR